MSGFTRWLKDRFLACGIDVTRGPHAVLIRRVGRHVVPTAEWADAKGLQLNLGSGGKPREGFINVDIAASPLVDLVASVIELPMLPDGCAKLIRMEAVYEHLYRWERPEALAEWFRLLAPGGQLEIDWIPDFDVILKLYLEQAEGLLGPTFDLEHVYRFTHGVPTPFNTPHQLHKDLFTKDSVTAELISAGFELVSLENVPFEAEIHAVNFNLVARKPADG